MALLLRDVAGVLCVMARVQHWCHAGLNNVSGFCPF